MKGKAGHPDFRPARVQAAERQQILDDAGHAVGFADDDIQKVSTPDGGTITVDAGVRGKNVWIEVSDTGIGIPPKDR